MNLPGFRLRGLKGAPKGHCAVSASGDWRVAFRFEDGATVDVDHVDCHRGDRPWECMIRRIRAAS